MEPTNDPADALRDIAPPMLVPEPLVLWPWIVGGLVALALIVWLIRWWMKRPKPAAATLSAQERLQAALDASASSVEEASPHDFSIRLSDALRLYVSEVHGLPATRQTSQEFLAALDGSRFGMESRGALQRFLGRCDVLKYAADGGTSADNAELLSAAKAFADGEKSPEAAVKA